ncbi:MAG: hypothetical protein AAF196_01605 [Planctomycetota bacterium]
MTSTTVNSDMGQAQVALPLEAVAPGMKSRMEPGKLSAVANGLLGVGILCVLVTLITYLAGGGEHAEGAHAGEAAGGHAGEHVSTSKQAAMSYITSFSYGLGLALGALFFVMVQHITRAGWSVLVRRVAENLMGVLSPWMIVLFVPIVFMASDIYHHWWHYHAAPGEEGYDSILSGKLAYLNPTFWYIRAAIYLGIWAALARFFRNASLKQDETGDPALTTKMAGRAAPGLAAFGLTLTFAAVDWIMTIDPHWYSTIFGLTFFGGAVVSMLALTTLIILFVQKKGYLKEINSEHFHDLGKLMFAFMVFWTYVNFSQYMLIWYANVPEETLWYQHRKAWEGTFALLSVGHFLVPFAFLMSRHMKRNKLTLAFASLWLLTMHWFDMQFVIMPDIHHDGIHPSWLDAVSMIGVVGVIVGATLRNIGNSPLIPERDPRLKESLHFHNV